MAPLPPPDCNAPGDAFVAASGTGLCLGGKPFRFVGVNRYDVASSASFRCGRAYDDDALERLFSELRASSLSVLRTWAFQKHVAAGFEPIDRLVDAARRHDVRLVLTLENEWVDCAEPDVTTADGRKGDAYWRDGWKTALLPHIEKMVSRYKDEPQIAMWQLVNEAESPDAAVLYGFAREASALVKSIDQRHLVSLGTIGTGQAGTTGDHYRRLHELDTIDLVEAHDYGHEREPMPAAIARNMSVALALGKPFFIGEAGIAAPQPMHPFGFEERAQLFEAKLASAFDRGASGYLVWSFYDLTTTNWEGWDFGPADPLTAVLKRTATSF
jgi:endo-1,4-beta-mannosidase